MSARRERRPDPVDAWVETIWAEATRLPRVLLAVQEPEVRQACRRVLLPARYSVVEPDPLDRARALARYAPPDAMIVQAGVWSSGWGLARDLREEVSAEVPLVVIVPGIDEAATWWARRLRAAALLPAASAARLLPEALERSLVAPW